MAVQTRSHVLKLLDAHQEQIRAFGVKRCGLFGSFVRQDSTAQSDVDILVEFEPGEKTFKNFINLAFFLELFGRKVDLVTEPLYWSSYLARGRICHAQLMNI